MKTRMRRDVPGASGSLPRPRADSGRVGRGEATDLEGMDAARCDGSDQLELNSHRGAAGV